MNEEVNGLARGCHRILKLAFERKILTAAMFNWWMDSLKENILSSGDVNAQKKYLENLLSTLRIELAYYTQERKNFDANTHQTVKT